MIATELSDVLFGTPKPVKAKVNLGVLKADEVNIVVHGHEPILSEMIAEAAQASELLDLAKSKGANGINVCGMCCTGNELLMRRGIPVAGNFLNQELALVSGAVEAMVNVVLVSRAREIYSTCLLPYYVSGELEEERLLFREPGFCADMNVTVISNIATKVMPSDNVVVLEDAKRISYDKLLIATGSSALKPDMKGCDKHGVFSLKTADDARSIAEWSRSAVSAVVVGAGFIGVEAAVALRKRGMKVCLVEMQDRVLPAMLDKETAKVVQQQLETNGIEVILEYQAMEFQGNGKVDGVGLSHKILNCDIALVAVGISPNTDIVDGSGIDVGTGIIVNEYMRTNVENIYAAGDVAETIDFVSQKRTVNAIWPNATRQGKIAAHNILGDTKTYAGSDRMNVIDIFGMPIVAIGHQSPDGDTLTAQGKRFDFKGSHVVGFTSAGDARKAGVVLSLIREGTDISRIRDYFPREDFGYGKVVRPVSHR